MRDISLLTQSVQDRSVRPLVDESINALNGGACRAAVVSLWVAVSVDLMNKVRTLAEGGDGTAKSFVDEVDEAVQANDVKRFLKCESGLVSFAEEDLELLERQEAVHLRRLYDDRNLCAHPSFNAESDLFSPTVEAVRAHLVAACDAVFNKSAVAGKRRVRLLIAELQGDSWPKRARLHEYLSSRFFQGASSSTVSNMWKLLVKSAIVPPEDTERPLVVARRAREAAICWREFDPSGFGNALSDVLKAWENAGKLTDQALARAVGAFGCLSEFEGVTPNTAFDRSIAYVARADVEDLVENRMFVGGRPLSTELSTVYERALERLGFDQLERAVKQTYTLAHFVSPLLELIGKARNFAEAAERVALLEKLSPHMSPMDLRTLEDRIVHNPGDQIRPARDVEESLIAAFETANSQDEEILIAWRELAETLADTTDANRYYGNHQETPYALLVQAVNT